MEVKPGYKQTEVGVIPEEWDARTLLDLAEHKKELFDDGDWVEAEFLTDCGIRLIQTGNIGEGKFTDRDVKKYISSESFKKLRCKDLQVGDILICRLADPAGRACVLHDIGEDRMITAVDVTIFRPPAAMADRHFLVSLFTTSRWYQTVAERCGGSTRTRISRRELGKISVPLPPLTEQCSIAATLNDVDALLGGLDRLIAKKRDIKQAAMQQLLTGRTRLPGFRGEWEMGELGQLGCISGAGVDKKIRPGDPPVRLVNYMDVYRRSFIRSTDLNHVVSASPDQLARCAVQKGDVFFTPSSEMPFDIAASAVAVEDIPDACYSYHVVRFRLNEDWDLRFRAYAFKTQAFLDQAARTSEGSGVRYVITQGKFRELTVHYPSDKAEQAAIAAVLTDMDAELAKLEARRDKTRNLKKAMMQELLTGKTRLLPAGVAHA